MSSPAGGVFVYHPLNSQTPLFSLYDGVVHHLTRPSANKLSEDDRMRLQNRYRQHMRDVFARRGLDEKTCFDPDFKEDNRALVQRFRAFWPAFVGKTTLTEKAEGVAVFFPSIDCFDNRCVEIKGHNEAIFITSRTLDTIELFANTLSMAVFLNGLELRVLLGLEDPPPPHLLLAWMTMAARSTPDVLMLDALTGPKSRAMSARALHDELYAREYRWLPEAGRRGWAHYRLSSAITWLMLVALHQLIRGAHSESERFIGVTAPLPPSTSMLSLDSQYFSTLILAFIVLHEVAHIALGHNKASGPPVDPVIQKIVDGAMAHAAETGAEAHDLLGSFVGHETGADGFALDVIEEDYRDPMLETATLWCAALSGTNDDCGDWLDNFGKDPRGKYPAFSMRVWFLNGRFSSGRRQGPIAQAITRQAEALAKAIRQAEESSDISADVFRKLWDIAMKETGVASGVLSRILTQFGKH